MKVVIHLKKPPNYFENHPSIVNIKRKDFDTSFPFRETNSNEVTKLIKTFNINKACQNTDIPTKIINSNADLFASYIFRNFNDCFEKAEFPYILTLYLYIRKKKKLIKQILGRCVSSPNCLKFMKK